MALTSTQLVEAAVKAGKLYSDFEGRISNAGALKAFLDSANAMLPTKAIENIKNQSNARSVVIPMLQKADITTLSARSCSITGVQPNSAKVTLTKITKGFEILHYPKIYENNYISEEDAVANGMRNGLRKVSNELDTYAAGVLESNKNTGLVSTNLPGVAISGNAYQVDSAKRDRLYFILRILMERNDIDANVLDNIMSTEGLDLLLQYESMGNANQQNLAAVLEGDLPSAKSNFRNYRSNRITNGTGVSETHYIVPFGMLGLFTFNDSDAIAKREGPNGAKSYLMTDPILNVRWDVYEEPVCSDLSATYGSGFERTLGTRYQFAADFGFFTAYSSDTTKPIVKVEVLAEA